MRIAAVVPGALNPERSPGEGGKPAASPASRTEEAIRIAGARSSSTFWGGDHKFETGRNGTKA